VTGRVGRIVPVDTFEALTLAVASYGALVATLVAWHQLITIRTRVSVGASRMQLVTPAPPGEPNPEPEDVVMVTMTNHSQHPVKVTHVSFSSNTKGRWLLIPRPYPVHEPLPIAIESRDSKVVWTHPHVLADALDLEGKVRARVSTSDGKTFTSRRAYLDLWKRRTWRRLWRRQTPPTERD
jgi:hypothetical protein